jgi:hypothetical protein
VQRLDLTQDKPPVISRRDFKRSLVKSLFFSMIGFVVLLLAFTVIPFVAFILPLGTMFFWATIGLSLVMFKVFFDWVTNIERQGRRYAAVSAGQQIEKDSRPPILLLRSFSGEYVNNYSRLDQVTEQEMLTLVLKDVGPVVAIGNPDDDLPPLGPAMEYVQNGDWQSVVIEFMKKSQLVVIEPGYGDGLSWEVQTARKECPPEKLVFSLLPISLPDAAGHNSEFEPLRPSLERSLGMSLPVVDKKSMFLCFDSDWKPRVIEAPSNNDFLFLEGLKLDTTLVKIRESLRPWMKARGAHFKTLANFKNLLGSAIRPAIFVGFLLMILSAVGAKMFVSQLCRTGQSEYILNSFPCDRLPRDK